MTEQNCNIVKDLLPLYQENLCSEDSRNYVESHLARCESCRNTHELLTRTALTEDAAEMREVNAFQKLRDFLTVQIRISYLLFLAAMVAAVLILLIYVSHVPHDCYFLLMPLMMLATDFTFGGRGNPSPATRLEKSLIALQGVPLLCGVLLTFYVTCTLLYRDPSAAPFGIALDRTGPLLAALFVSMIGLSLAILAACLYQTVKGKMSYGVLPNMTILCIFLNLTYRSKLYFMSSREYWLKAQIRDTLVLCCIFAVLSLIMRLAHKARRSGEI